MWYWDRKYLRTLILHLYPHPELAELHIIAFDSEQCIGLDDDIVHSFEALL